MSERWAEVQVKYLEFNYKHCTNKELAETLGKSELDISKKLSDLGLKRRLTPKIKEEMIKDYLQKKFPNEDIKGRFENYKVCNICKKVLLVTNFYKNRKFKDGYRMECKNCTKKYEINRRSKRKQKEAYERFKQT